MARLSGQPAEQPADAPRRKRGRPSQTPSVDLTSAMKRPASPSQESSAPKRKRVQLDDTQLSVDIEESAVARSQSHDGDTIHLVQESTTRRTRRHSEPPISAQDDADDGQKTPPPSTQPPSGLTPHLDRLGVPTGRPSNIRRARMSMPSQLRVEAPDDNIGNEQLQFAPLSAVLDSRTRRRLRRSHLSQEINEIEDHQKQDKKLRKQYAELSRQLKEKDKVIADLEFQLEARRMGNIDMTDDRAEELELELAQARKAIDELRSSSLYNGESRELSVSEGNLDDADFDDEDGTMLIDPEDLPAAHGEEPDEPLPNGTYASRALALSSQVTVNSLSTITETSQDVLAELSQADSASIPDTISDKAVKRYEIEIERLNQQLADSRAALRVIAIELQNLHVVEPGASSDVILAHLRRAFEAVRQELENLIPNSTTGLTNYELLRKIPELFEGVLTELREKTLLSETNHQTVRQLRRQFEGAVTLLSEAEDRIKELDSEVHDLQQNNTAKEETIAELSDRVNVLSGIADQQKDEIIAQDAQIKDFQKEVREKDTSIDRLQAAVDTYHKDIEAVTKATMELEDRHRQTIQDMEETHTDQLLSLRSELADESEARKIAEGQAEQKDEYIDELEEKLKGLEDDFLAIKEDTDQLRARLAAEIQQREAVEAECEEQSATVYAHANQIENLTESIRDLESQVEELQANLKTERLQREETETALDEANAQIADLDTRLHDAGIQANELRSKMFELQQEKNGHIEELKSELATLEEENGRVSDDADQARIKADQKIADLEAQIDQLQEDIAVLEEQTVQMSRERDDLEKDRDDHVASLNAQLVELRQKYAALESSTNSTITTLEANITDLNNEVNAQRVEIDRISEEAADAENDLRDELAVKTEQISKLEDDLAKSRGENEKLAKENKSLAARVDEEALHLLEITDSHDRERKALLQVINTHEGTIKTLQNAAAQRAAEHERAIADLSEEIEELRLMGDVRAEHIVNLEAQIEEMKEQFRVAEEDTRATIDTLMESQRKLQDQNEALAVALKKRNAEALQAVREMKVKGVEIKTNGFDLHKVTNGKVTKVNERVKVGKKGSKKKVAKRRWGDSGIGVDDDVEANLDEASPEAVVG